MVATVKLIEVKGKHKPLTSKDIKYVKAMGIELEGGWYIQPENIHEDESIRNITRHVDLPQFIMGDEGEHDCHVCIPHKFTNGMDNIPGIIYCNDNCTISTHCDDSCDKHCGCQFKLEPSTVVGECISPPYSIEEIRDWISSNAPDKVNNTCGLHIHVSMKNDGDYLKLADKEFYNFFLDWIKKWARDVGIPASHEFWDRIEGRNKYCMPTFQPELQMTLKDKHPENKAIRRTILNYCFNFVKEDGMPRKTLECRVFPAFNHAGYIVLALEAFVKCIETYLTTKGNSDLRSIQVFKTPVGRLIEDNIDWSSWVSSSH